MIEENYNSTVVVKRATEDTKEKTYDNVVESGLLCWIRPYEDKNKNQGTGTTFLKQHVLRCASNANIRVGDYVVKASTVWEVNGVSKIEDPFDEDTHLKVMMTISDVSGLV